MDLVERLRADAELIHNNGITRKLRRHRVAALLREAAELARRFEDAPEAFYRGHRIRMVPDTHTPPDPGHEREVPDGGR